MKTTSRIVFALLVLSGAAFARILSPQVERAISHGADAKFCLKVCDDMGYPVSNASVRVFFDMLPKPHSVYGKTDTNGVCVIKGRTNGNTIEFLVGKDGYYGSNKMMTFIKMGEEHDVTDGKWQPYCADEGIVLRRIRSPISLTTGTKLQIPVTNTWIGVDIAKKSLVKPWGDGDVLDLEICVDWDGLPPWESAYCQGVMRFPGVLSGGYYVDNVRESQNKYPYNANETADYVEKMVRIVNRNGTLPNLLKTRVPFREESSLVIRTRCALDEHGVLNRANYGCIHNFSVSPGKNGAATLVLSYSFNPTPNDTNLEDIKTAERARYFIRQCEPTESE